MVRIIPIDIRGLVARPLVRLSQVRDKALDFAQEKALTAAFKTIVAIYSLGVDALILIDPKYKPKDPWQNRSRD